MNHDFHVIERDGRTKTIDHACLKNGFWCWKNIFEKPSDLKFYFKWKVREWLNSLN